MEMELLAQGRLPSSSLSVSRKRRHPSSSAVSMLLRPLTKRFNEYFQMEESREFSDEDQSVVASAPFAGARKRREGLSCTHSDSVQRIDGCDAPGLTRIFNYPNGAQFASFAWSPSSLVFPVACCDWRRHRRTLSMSTLCFAFFVVTETVALFLIFAYRNTGHQLHFVAAGNVLMVGFVASCVVANVLYLALGGGLGELRWRYADPGFISCSGAEVDVGLLRVLQPGDREDGTLPSPKLCRTCRRIMPIRSKHCHDCGRCVGRMDHHCHWLGSCVGGRNRALFMCLLFWMFVSVTWGVYLLVSTFQQISMPHCTSRLCALTFIASIACGVFVAVFVALAAVMQFAAIASNSSTYAIFYRDGASDQIVLPKRRESDNVTTTSIDKALNFGVMNVAWYFASVFPFSSVIRSSGGQWDPINCGLEIIGQYDVVAASGGNIV